MRHPDDQPTGNSRSFRSDRAVTNHDVARTSEAELLSLYQGLFAQSDAGRYPGIYDVHGPSLQELAEGDDKLSRAGNELARRHEERGGAFATSFSAGHPHDSFLTAQQNVAQSQRHGSRFLPTWYEWTNIREPSRISPASTFSRGELLPPDLGLFEQHHIREEGTSSYE